MKILVIGGTKFVGRCIVSEAMRRNHTLTLFNRGETNADIFPEAEKIVGDREGDLDSLKGREWDAVIDTCGYLPRSVGKSAKALAGRVGSYVFISSVSVYEDFSRSSIGENDVTKELADPTSEDTKADYGPLKALCEKSVLREFSDKSLIVRPGIIVGPYDPTDRFTYWVRRIAEDAEVLVPDCPDAAFQYVYAGDLARWMLTMVEDKLGGTFNAVTPAGELTWGNFLETCRETLNPSCRLVAASETFLLENKVTDWSQLPLWISQDRSELSGFYRIDGGKAKHAGLGSSPLSEVILETYDWVRAMGGSYGPKLGLDTEQEKELIEAVLHRKR